MHSISKSAPIIIYKNAQETSSPKPDIIISNIQNNIGYTIPFVNVVDPCNASMRSTRAARAILLGDILLSPKAADIIPALQAEDI